MKLRNVLLVFFATIFAFSAHAAVTNRDSGTSFSRTFRDSSYRSTVSNQRTITTESGTSKGVVSRNRPSRTYSEPVASSSSDDESWGVFGFYPKEGRDGSMFPNPDGCTLIDGSPCTKKCPGKFSCTRDKGTCTKPCGTKCNQPCGTPCAAKTPCSQVPLCTGPTCQPCAFAPVVATPVYEIPEAPCNYMTIMEDDIYNSIHYNCGDFAPIELQWVDFRIEKNKDYGSYGKKLGNYRFRIFGCRRDSKEITLNQGRALQKDMHFMNIFQDITKGCINTVKTPKDLCLNPNQPLPEYVLTAEITDYFMNVCDEYDWKDVEKKDKRNGSAEITITWRIMDLTKTNVLWKGTSSGYADVKDGRYNGELMLIEKAFADAVDNLRQQPGFEQQLATRVDPQELYRQRQLLTEAQVKEDPIKCQYNEREVIALQRGGCPACPQCAPCQNAKEELIVTKEGETVYVTEGNEGAIEKLTVVEENSGSGETLAIVEEDSGTGEKITIIEEDGKITSISGATEGVEVKTICTVGGSESTGICPVTEIEESSDAFVEVKSVEENSDADAKGTLCIKDRVPYDELSSEAIYNIRSSIVSVTNTSGKKVAGLLISEQYILTSADVVIREDNSYNVETINGDQLKAKAYRFNTKKNIALLVLEKEIKYVPLSISSDLPDVESDVMSIGLLEMKKDGDYLDSHGKVTGYRYSDDIGAEIITDTFVQNVSVGGSLVNKKGTVLGVARTGKSAQEEPDLFLPVDTALQGLGLEICGREPVEKRKYTPISDAIEQIIAPRDPAVLKKKERK